MTTVALANERPKLLSLWRQFLPLSVSDVTMAFCDPLIVATLAQLPDARSNLAAVGIAKALVVFFESPIIMLLHASNVLADNKKSHQVLRRFMLIACIILTCLLCLLTIPPIFSFVSQHLLNIEASMIQKTRDVLLLLILWPGVIAWRRYHQGFLIHNGHSQAVSHAGILRLIVVAAILGAGYCVNVSGTTLAGLALIGGVLSESALVTLLAKKHSLTYPPESSNVPERPQDLKGVWRFYWPLANSMLVVWGGRAVLVAVVARSVDSAIALAAWPAAWSLVLVVANATRMLQQVVIRNRGKASDLFLLVFALSVGLVCLSILFGIAGTATGLQIVQSFVGSDPSLLDDVKPVILLCATVPLIIAVQNGVQGLLMSDGRTGRINASTWLGTLTLLSVAIATVNAGIPGATAAAIAMLAALVIETLWLAMGLSNVLINESRAK